MVPKNSFAKDFITRATFGLAGCAEELDFSQPENRTSADKSKRPVLQAVIRALMRKSTCIHRPQRLEKGPPPSIPIASRHREAQARNIKGLRQIGRFGVV